MNKRQRVLAALEGRSVDRVPFAMWRHFYLQSQTVEGLTRSTLDYYGHCDTDVIVFTPGPFYMAEAWGIDPRSFSTDDMAPYLVGPLIQRATDWRQLPSVDVPDSSLRREIEAVRAVRARLSDNDAPLVVRIPSPLATADVLCDGRVLQDMRSFSSDLRSALQVIADATAQFALACMGAGADGYLFFSHLASREKMRLREYRDFGLQFDLQVLAPLASADIRLFHFEAPSPMMDIADRYPVQAVCWETWRAEPSLSSASNQLRGALMGGLNPLTFSDGSVADVREQIADAIAQTGGWRFMLSPSSALPTDSRDDLLIAVRQLVTEMQRQ
jgi:uroporphyrinogen decarboxylase